MAKKAPFPCGFLSFAKQKQEITLATSFVSVYNVKWDERYDSEEHNTTTHYFSADKSLLAKYFPNQYPDADSCEISVEFPSGQSDPCYWTVMLSPTKETSDGQSDYDWTDIELSSSEADKLWRLIPQTP